MHTIISLEKKLKHVKVLHAVFQALIQQSSEIIIVILIIVIWMEHLFFVLTYKSIDKSIVDHPKP